MRSTLVALATVAAAACASTPLADPMLAALDGTSWRLATLRGAPVLGSTIATLTFERDHVFGTGGTNRFFGGWSVDGDRLTFSKVGSTRRLGTPDAQRQEDLYFATLEGVDGARRAGDELVLTADGEDVLTFESR